MGDSLSKRGSGSPPTRRERTLLILLRWEGELKNARVQQVLGVNTVHASKLIRQLREGAPEMLRNDTLGRRWDLVDRERLEQRLAGAGTLGEYLQIVGSDAAAIADVRADFLLPDPVVFARVRKACVEGRGLDVTYDSMTRPEGARRTIYPHTMIHLCRRWHVRAWCAERRDFRDFTLGRMRDLQVSSEARQVPRDIAWETQVPLEIVPHSALSAAQQTVIRREYFAGGTGRTLSCRGPLAGYLLQDLQVAADPEKETPPAFQLQLANPSAVTPYLFPAGNEENAHGTHT